MIRGERRVSDLQTRLDTPPPPPGGDILNISECWRADDGMPAHPLPPSRINQNYYNRWRGRCDQERALPAIKQHFWLQQSQCGLIYREPHRVESSCSAAPRRQDNLIASRV